MFQLTEFYKQLDSYYAVHDNAGAEAFMKKSQQEALDQGAIDMKIVCDCPGAKTLPDEPNINYVSVCNELACYYWGMSEFQKSIDTFRLAEKELEDKQSLVCQEYGTLMLNKAGTLRLMGATDAALDCFKNAMYVLEQLDHRDPAVLAGLFNNIGLVYLDKKEPENALGFFERAISLVEENESLQDKAGITFNNIATANYMSGDYDAAKVAVNKAISTLEKQNNGSSPHYPAALNTRATIEFKKGNYEGALEDFKNALDRTKVCYGENVEYAKGCKNIAITCNKLGHKEESDEWLKKGDAVMDRIRAR